ncbi:MAG: hypothetical protein H0W75_05940 [Chitinophagaceae bacterium]|nr:hypothetical protein [Chitinophagaceae bacterium]
MKIKELRAFNKPPTRHTLPHSQNTVTPSGSADPDMNIPMGSVSLQDYPEKNTTCNSYNSSSPEATPVIEEAIVITSSEKEGDTARIITGTFNAKIYSDNKKSDAKRTEHIIKGKFRIRHEFHSYNGGQL